MNVEQNVARVSQRKDVTDLDADTLSYARDLIARNGEHVTFSQYFYNKLQSLFRRYPPRKPAKTKAKRA